MRSLVQAKIDAEILAHEPEDSEHYEQAIESYSSMNIDDSLSWSFLRNVTLAQTERNYIPFEPDLNKLRLWIKNEHGGHVLKDHSKMGNIINLHGHKPAVLRKIGDQDGLTGNRLANAFDGNEQFDPKTMQYDSDIIPGGQYIRIPDNSNVRIKELLSTDAITIFCRIYPVSLPERDYMILFSKIDDEQVTCAYAGLIDSAGFLHFIVRKDNKERTIKTLLWSTSVDKADYDSDYYQSPYYKTAAGAGGFPSLIPFVDLALTCKFSDMSMSIIKNGVEVATTAIDETGLVGHWRLNEGGNIGTTVQEQTPSQRIAYNSSFASGATNGTITGALWITPNPESQPHETYLDFPFTESGKYVSVDNYTGIATYTEITVSFWYHPTEFTIAADRWLVSKDWSNNGSWIVYRQGTTNKLYSTFKNDAGSTASTVTGAAVTDQWYHVIARWKAGNPPVMFNNGVKTTSGTSLSGTISTSTASLLISRNNTTNNASGYITDLKIWNRELSDGECTAIYEEGHHPVGFPAWKADPPIPDESPDPITNPFVKYYDVDWITDPAQRDITKLHAKIISGFTTFYDTNDDDDIAGSQQNLPYYAFYDVQSSGGGGGSPTVAYDLAYDSEDHLEMEDSGDGTYLAVRAVSSALVGKVVTRIACYGDKPGSPAGTAYYKIWKASGGVVDLGNHAASSLPDGDTLGPEIDCSTNSYVLASGDRVGLQYTTGETDDFQLSQNDGSSSETSWASFNGTSWSQLSTNCCFKIWVGGGGAGGYTILQNIPRDPWNPAVNNRVAAYISSGSYDGVGRKITKVVVQMTKVGSPGGTITCRIFKGGSTSDTVQIGPSKTAADIPTSQGNVTFEFATEAERAAQTYALVNGDRIGIYVSGGSSSDSNYYIVHHNQTSSKANIYNTYWQTVTPDTGWQYDNSAYELIGQFYDGGFMQTIPTVYAHVKLDHTTVRAAEHFATSSAGIGKIITKITPRFKKYGGPTGSVSVVIRNSSGTLMTDFGSIDAVADIPAGDTWTAKEFTNITNTRQCAAGDRISVEYGSGDANNYVMVSMNLNHDNYDASLSYAQTWPAGGSAYANAGGVTTYDIAGLLATGGVQTDPLGRTRVGQRCNAVTSVMRGKKVTRVTTYLHKVGTPTADTYVLFRVRKADTDAIAYTIGQILATSLATSATAYTIENVNNVYAMQQNDILTVEYESGDDSNYVVLTRSKNDVYEVTGNLSQIVDYNAPSYSPLTSDLIGELWTGGDTYTPAVDEQIIRDPFYHHDLLIAAGGWDWSYYQAIGTINNHVGVHIMPEFRIYRQELSVSQALNLYQNRCSISALTYGTVAKVGTLGVAENPPE